MKDFTELRKDFIKNPELMSVLNDCSCVEDIRNGFANKGYEVTDEDLNGFCKEKLPVILKEHPELKESIAAAQGEDPDLNGVFGLDDVLVTIVGVFIVSSCASLGVSCAKHCGG